MAILFVILFLKTGDIGNMNCSGTMTAVELGEITRPIYFLQYNNEGQDGCGGDYICKQGVVNFPNYSTRETGLGTILLTDGLMAPANGTYFLFVRAVTCEGEGALQVRTSRKTHR